MTHLWIPRIKLVENTRRALPTPHAAVGGVFSLRGFLDDGRSRIIADLQPNLITDAGLDRMGIDTQIVNCSVGDGNTTPQFSDTALTSFVAQHNTTTGATRGYAPSAPYFGYWRNTFRFNPPGTNKILREVGFGWGTGGTNLFSHALIKDPGGSPLDVAWLANETLEVSYEARVYLPASDLPFITTINGVESSGIIRAAQATGSQYTSFRNSSDIQIDQPANPSQSQVIYISNGTIGAVTSGLTGTTETNPGSWTDLPAYSYGSFKRTGTYTIGPTKGNLSGGISAMLFTSGLHAYQFSISPPIAKVVDWTLTLNVETSTWGRYA